MIDWILARSPEEHLFLVVCAFMGLVAFCLILWCVLEYFINIRPNRGGGS